MELINSYEDESETSGEGRRYIDICRNDSFLMLSVTGVIDEPVKGGSAVEVFVDPVGTSIGSRVVSREHSVAVIPFVRNGWEVPELEATYDEDEDVVPAFVEVVPGVEVAGKAVVKYRDAAVGWRYLVQAEVVVMKLCIDGLESPVMRLNVSEERSLRTCGESCVGSCVGGFCG